MTSLSTSKNFLGNHVEGWRVLNTGVEETFLGTVVKGYKTFLEIVLGHHRGGGNSCVDSQKIFVGVCWKTKVFWKSCRGC